MALHFLDSSALVKRYVYETGSSWLTDLFDPALGHNFMIAEITPVELVSAIARRLRSNTISAVDAAHAIQLIYADITSDYQTIDLTSVVVGRAMALAETHALRGYDAVQLSSALAVNALVVDRGGRPIIFVSSDHELNHVASLEGIAVVDPNLFP